MAKNDWYTFTTTEEGYQAHKYGPDGNHIDSYNLNKNGSTCDCPAHVPWCRHKKMLMIFKDMERINTGWQYNVDKDDWKEPIKIEWMDDDDGQRDENGTPLPPAA